MTKQHIHFQDTTAPYRDARLVLHQLRMFSFCIAEISFHFKKHIFKEHICGRSWNRTCTHGASSHRSTIRAILPFRLSDGFSLGHKTTSLILSKLFQNITRQTESCLWPLTILRIRRHPFCLSLRVVADARIELALSDQKSDVYPPD